MNFDQILSGGKRSPRWVLRGFLLFTVSLVAWAALSRIDQVTHGRGQVIAVARTQIIQSPDGGVLKETLVKEGDQVEPNQIVALLQKDRVQAAYDDARAKVAALRITLARLRAEVFEKPLIFDENLMEYTEFINNQKELFTRRQRAIDEDLRVLNEALSLAKDELAMNESLEATGDVGRAEVLRMRRQVIELKGQIQGRRNKYFQDSQAELTKAEEELSTQEQSFADKEAILSHTELRSPTSGIVKNLRINTVGGVLKPGDAVMEILPTDSDLIVEVRLPPGEVGFIHPGLPATVKLDAYDYSIYGDLKGEIYYVSADSLNQETRNGDEPYYRVLVRIHGRSFKGVRAQEIQVSPGMTAAVDIRTGTRSVLSFLTKPITKTLLESFSER